MGKKRVAPDDQLIACNINKLFGVKNKHSDDYYPPHRKMSNVTHAIAFFHHFFLFLFIVKYFILIHLQLPPYKGDSHIPQT